MLQALGSVASVLCMIALGFLLAKKGWFEEGAKTLLSRLVVGIALPAYMIANLMGSYDRAKLLAMLPGLPLPFLALLACYGLALLLGAAIRLPRGRRGTFASLLALSNTIFIGLPVNLIFFGPESLPFVLLFYIANTSIFWTIGMYGIARDGAHRRGGRAPELLSLESLRRVASPPLLAFLASTAMILLGLGLPAFFLDTCKTLGSLTTPLSMLFVGLTLAGADWKKLKLDLSLVLVLLGRFLLSPLLVYFLAAGSGLPLLMKEVFVVQATMPSMTQTPILAKAYGADEEYAAMGTSLTTLVSLATIPLWMSFVSSIW